MSNKNENKEIKKKNMRKKLKYNSYSSVVIVIVIAIAIVLNLIVGMSVDRFGLKIDLTPTNVFEISDTTKELLKKVDKDINIYLLTDNGSSSAYFSYEELTNIMDNIDVFIGNYQSENSKIHFSEIYANSNPTFMEKYTSKGETIHVGSLIVESGDKYKVLNTNTYFKQASVSGELTMQLEQLITSAIAYVISDKNYEVGFTNGHNENSDVVDALKDVYAKENYDCKDINLATDKIDEDICTIIISNPSMDFTSEELAKLDECFKAGKNLMVFMDVTDVTLPNLYAYLAEWGIVANNDMVIEDDTSKYLSGTPYAIIGTIGTESDITTPIKESNVYFPYARSIDVIAVPSVTTEALYTTSDVAYAKVNLYAETGQKEEGDKSGPFTLATLSKRQLYVNNDTVNAKLFVCGSAQTAAMATQEGANKQFVINVINNINNRSETITIEDKQISKIPTFEITQNAADFIEGIVVYIVPLVIILIGLLVWLKRKQA